MHFFTEIEKNLKVDTEIQTLSVSHNNPEQEKTTGSIPIPDFKLYSRDIAVKAA